MQVLTRTALAIDGGRPAVSEPLPRFNTIDGQEASYANDALLGPLSGYLGGERHGGYWVERLEKEWAEIFGVRHAVSCNSGTSGLLMACMAGGIGPGITVITTPYTMSATAAAPRFLGAKIKFTDIEPDTFCLPSFESHKPWPTIVTNLFGHPANLHSMMKDRTGILIEDNAQAIFAEENGRYAGTIGNIGVFSLNVHKHLQCGEGGICVTNDDGIAYWLRMARNHGEMASGKIGLNLRMTEVTAAIACSQLHKHIMRERIEIAMEITAKALPLFEPPVIRDGCTHSFYVIAWKTKGNRRKIVEALKAEGVPVKEGYLEPLYHLPAFQPFRADCPVVERIENKELITYENCSWTPTARQLKQFRIAFEKVADAQT